MSDDVCAAGHCIGGVIRGGTPCRYDALWNLLLECPHPRGVLQSGLRRVIRLVRDLDQAVVGGGADPSNLSHLLGQLVLLPAGGVREGDDLHVELMVARDPEERWKGTPAVAGG